uniref:Uncharacterized protein n=1 Tax=Clytia hemisphaerica TaxID=252671 RepID=A0A7M5UF07_9CNID
VINERQNGNITLNRWAPEMNFYYLIALGVLFLPVPSSKKFVSGAGVPPVQITPRFKYIYPDEVSFPQIFQCINNIPKCHAGGCITKWLVESKILKSTSSKYLEIDNNKALLVRAPLSRTRQKGPFACVIEKNGKVLGTATGYLKFVTIPKKYTERDPPDGSTIEDGGERKLDIAGAFKDGKNAALILIIFILFFVSTAVWGLIIYFKVNSPSPTTKDGYKLLEEQRSEEGEYEEVEDEYEEADKGKNKAKKEEKKEKKSEVKKGEKRKEEKKKEDSSKKKREEKKKKQVDSDPYYDEPYEEDYDTVKQRNATKDGYKLLEEQGSEEGEYEEVEDEYEEADRGKNKAKKEEKKEKKNEVKKGEKRKEEKKKEEKKKEDSSKKKREEKKKKQVENDPYYDEPYEEDYDTVKQRNDSINSTYNELAEKSKKSSSSKKGASRAPPSNDEYDDVFEGGSDLYDDVMVQAQAPQAKKPHLRGHRIPGLPPESLIKELSRIPVNPPQGRDAKLHLISRNNSSKHHRSRSKSRNSDDSEIAGMSTKHIQNSSSIRSHKGHSSRSSSKR